MPVDLKIDARQLDKLAKALSRNQKEMKASVISALNKSLSSVNTALQREITQKYNITKGELSGGKQYKSYKSNNLIRLKKASSSNTDARIEVRGSTLTLGRFLRSQQTPISHRGKTIGQIRKIPTPKVMVYKGRSRSTAAHTFTARKNGVTHVFERDGNDVDMAHTLSTAQMASNPDVAEKVQKLASEIIDKKVEQELNYRIDKMIRSMR